MGCRGGQSSVFRGKTAHKEKGWRKKSGQEKAKSVIKPKKGQKVLILMIFTIN